MNKVNKETTELMDNGMVFYDEDTVLGMLNGKMVRATLDRTHKRITVNNGTVAQSRRYETDEAYCEAYKDITNKIK